MTAQVDVDTGCIECQTPMVSQGAYARLTKEERVGKTRTGAHGMCQACYRRSRTPAKKPKGPLADDTVAKLRRAVGVPENGPTLAMKKAWAAEENGRPTPVVDKRQAELDQLRAEIKQVREAFDILLDERDQLARQVDEVDQLREQVEVQQRRAERAEHQRNTWKGDHDRLAAELARVQALKVVDVAAEVTAAQAEAWEERDRLAGLLEEATARITEMQRQVEDVIATADRLIVEASTPAPHRHAWEWQPGLKHMPLPCACGRPWPRNRPPFVY